MKKAKALLARAKCNSSPIATLLFLLAAVAFLCGCILLLQSIVQNTLQKSAREQETAIPVSSPAPQESTPAPARVVSAIRTPPVESSATPSATPTVSPVITPSPSVSPTTATPAPVATLLPLQNAAPFSDTSADILFICMDAESRPDWIAVLRIRSDDCRVLSIPRNTIAANDKPLSSATTFAACQRLLENIWPIRYSRTMEVGRASIAAIVDQFGGIRLGENVANGAEVLAYLDEGPTDELLRITRQQSCLSAFVNTLRTASPLALLSARFLLQSCVKSNIKITESIPLLDLLRTNERNTLALQTLPVDSVHINGQRYYEIDITLVNRLAETWRR